MSEFVHNHLERSCSLAAIHSFVVVGAMIAGLTVLPGNLGAEPPVEDLLKLHLLEAKTYSLWLDRQKKQGLTLREQPVFSWTNVAGPAPQYGHVFVWERAGRPEVIGTIFSTRAEDPRQRGIIHEFHTLAEQPLTVEYLERIDHRWQPAGGITMNEVPKAAAVAETAAGRLTQMRAIARQFKAETRKDDERYELRLLPAPALRYQSDDGRVLDGAIFSMVSSAGTDPELLIVLEARRPANAPAAKANAVATAADCRWHAQAIRFTERELTVDRDGVRFWSSTDNSEHWVSIENQYKLLRTPQERYCCFWARAIPELPDAPPK